MLGRKRDSTKLNMTGLELLVCVVHMSVSVLSALLLLHLNVT